MSELLLKRVEEVRDFTGRLNVLYVIHDVLHHSVKLRDNSDKDPFSEALLPYLGDILRLTYKEADHTNEKDKVKKVFFPPKISKIFFLENFMFRKIFYFD